MRKWFQIRDIDLLLDEKSSSSSHLSSLRIGRIGEPSWAFPPSLKSQYNIIYYAILETKVTIWVVASIIASYSLSVGYKTEFRRRHFTYSCYNAGYPTAVTYNAGAPDFQNALLDFSFRGSCTVRFKIQKKGDEMWLGVVGDPSDLDERLGYYRGMEGKWAFYCGRSMERYYVGDDSIAISREQMLSSFKPVLNGSGVQDDGYGSFHFPKRFCHRLVPCNTGDIVDMKVDAQEKTFAVMVNGVFQATSDVPDLPEQLIFFVKVDATDDCVEFEIVDFKFEKSRKQKEKRLAKIKDLV